MKKYRVVFAAFFCILLTGCSPEAEKHLESSPVARFSPEAARVYAYLQEMCGKGVLAGQQESTWLAGPDYEIDLVFERTGKYPAIRGLDFINDDFTRVTRRSIDWWRAGGLVAIRWQWGVPPEGLGLHASRRPVEFKALFTEGTRQHTGMLEQIDRAAEALMELKEAGVPVLWSPLHEPDTRETWWGMGTPADFIALWRFMYDRYTRHFGLNNLVWVWTSGTNASEAWYPGDDFVDIFGYADFTEGSHTDAATRITALTSRSVPVAYHPCGVIPAPDSLIAEKTPWVWFLAWHTKYIRLANSPEHLKAVYGHPYVITRDKLPDFSTPKEALP